ncbi:Polymorphic membrane protein F,Type V secretory pathway, adhesin AidA,chlamydial polymorphic outer membrane protein repeat,Autotransporter beta-domain [Chlamydia serpentis]|uniref:Polymorphic membrane protein F,Type V secretory pathway, adhesin AidA,chlamydial polymorphic outer membrane protein repeat,Autotransporter beta-domain n=1 Tax=Chlamydia serpentis TaxID=1967782 RepID=A0A2R8FAX6_9CHLA|nr:polymorphic outer membrane protein middle domain-containing protein [Chlamydia serpentis]SPN73579.1 Polymorphic membrane protein F,Type V secretory pathway, adhesin AidA,chlamydial polymorphic outer membrane protein repeat,Autotransporter beta-domain [Chlamydia serpentis]
MKHSLHWLFTSSALFLSLSPLMAAETSLSSSDNYDGGGSAFNAKETSDSSGTIYKLSSDVSIKNVTTTNPTDKSCFTNSGGTLNFVGEGHSLTLQNIGLTIDGAAINNTNTALSFSGLSLLLIDSAPGSSTSGGNGAISVTNTSGGSVAFTENTSITLQNNSSAKDGAAISAYNISVIKTITAVLIDKNGSTKNGGAFCTTANTAIQENVGTITLTSNTATEKGGAIYSKASDSKLATNTGVVIFKANTAKIGGAWCSDDNLNLMNNTSVLFQQNQANATGSPTDQEGCGGAICNYLTAAAGKTGLTVSGNQEMSFTSNTATVSGGAIYATKCALSANDTITFDKNSAETSGGAIFTTSEDFSLTENTGIVTFSANTAKTAGALYSTGNTSFTKNKALVFSGNSATATTTANQDGCGGAILCNIADSDIATKSLLITENQSVNFSENSATASGGAIYATKCALSGSQSLTFENNTAGTSGGAIYSKMLSITANGSISFTNNSAGKGGAIYITDNGELSLEAIDGDIIFSGNRATQGTSTPNSIHLSTGAKISKLVAAPGRTIYFYDPITMETPGSGGVIPELVINPVIVKAVIPPQAQPKNAPIASVPVQPITPPNLNSGTIVFSSEKLSTEDASIPNNTTTILNQKINLAGGRVILKEGATLQVYSFTQNPNSVVFMDAGTTLETTKTSNNDGSITLTNLSVNLDALDGQRMVKVAVNSTTGSLKISGDLKFHNNEANFYDNPGLKNNLDLPFLDLSSTSGTVNLDDFNPLPSGMTTPTYGYQGKWSLVPKVESTGKVILVAEWQALGYSPKPELQASLVPNSLWNAYVNVRTIQQNIATAMLENPKRPGIWVGGIFNAFHQDKDKENAGFRLISGGYVIGGSMSTPEENTFAVAFSQLFAKSKDYVISNIKSQAYTGTVYAESSYILPLHTSLRRHVLSKIFPELPKETPLILHGQVSYARNHHNMTTKPADNTNRKSDWDSHSFAAQIGGSLPIDLNYRYVSSYSPYLTLQIVSVNQKGFKEQAPDPRSFGDSHLINFSIPMGITLKRASANLPTTWHLALGYIIDAYRDDPDCLTSLGNGTSWTTWATNLSRQAFFTEASAHHKVSHNFECFASGGCEFRSSSRSYNANCGTRYSF